MDFHADDHLPVAGGAFDELGFRVRSIHWLVPAGGARPRRISLRFSLRIWTMRHKAAAVPPAFAPRRNLVARQALADKSGLAEVDMTDNRAPNGKLGALLGALIAIALAVFLLNGGENLGKKSVNGDDDLPPVRREQRNASPKEIGPEDPSEIASATNRRVGRKWIVAGCRA